MKKILIINANYYNNISTSLVKNAKNFLKKNNINIDTIDVPGVFEIPITIRKFIKNYDGFIALGCVIKGETPHFDLICKSSFYAIMRISIDFNKPIGNGIITALNIAQAKKRSSFNKKLFKANKGLEAAKAVMSVLQNEPKKT
jgi:6,7-dimethyl-8-ribityllumazine synthase